MSTHSGIPAEVLPHLLRYVCYESEQSPQSAQRTLCTLLCTSRSLCAAAARHCQGLLHIRLHPDSSSTRALQFAGWLCRNTALVKELHLDLPYYSKEVEKAIAAALQPAKDADAAGAAAAAGTYDSGSPSCIQLQCYTCHSRTTGDSLILQALPAHSLTRLSLLFEEELDEVAEDLNGVTIPALAGLSKLQCVELQTSKGWDIDPVVPAVSALTALTRLHLHWLDDVQQLQHAPAQLLELGFYLQHGSRRPQILDLSHLTQLTSLDSGSHLGIRLKKGDLIPASLQELTVSDCDSVEPLAQLRQLRRLCVDDAKATFAQEIAALRCRFSGVDGSTGALAGASGRGSASARRVARSISRRAAGSSCNGMPERCLPMLTELQLRGCDSHPSRPVVTPEVVEAWLALQPALQRLDIDEVQSEMAEAVLQQLPKLQGLTQLALQNCDSFDVKLAEIGAAVGKLTGLQELRLHRFYSAQQYLDTDDVIPLTAAISGLSRLRSLTITGVALNVPELRVLQPCLTQLTSLRLCGCGLNDVMTSDLMHGLAGQQQQQLQDRHVASSEGGRSKAVCPALVQLGLSDNRQITDAVLPVLAKLLPGLTYLDLMLTGVTDRGMRFLQALTRLKELELDGTSVCLQEKMRALRKPVERQPWEVQEEVADGFLFV